MKNRRRLYEKNLKKPVAVYVSLLMISCTVTILIATAISYFSNTRQNDFSPAEPNIQIQENDTPPTGDTQTNSLRFILSADKTYYSADKKIEILNPLAPKNENPHDEEYVRVKLVPSWRLTENTGNEYIYANLNGISDFYSQKLNGNKLMVCDRFGTAIVTYILNALWQTEWTYNETDGCFYHKGLVADGSTASKLVESVQISKSVYDEAEDCTLVIDVLADAVQQYGTPLTDRDTEWQNAVNLN